MAKKPAKETNVPLICALVFFVLTTIAFGVMWYMQYSEQQAKDEAVKKAGDKEKAATTEANDAKNELRIVRILLGIPEEKDIETVASETSGKAKIDAKVKQINDAIAKSVGVEDPSKLPDRLKLWTMDDKGSAGQPPSKGYLAILGEEVNARNSANEKAEKAVKEYHLEVEKYKAAESAIEEIKKSFQQVAADLPKKFEADLKAATDKFDSRTKDFTTRESAFREENTNLTTEKQKLEREKERATRIIGDLNTQLTKLALDSLRKQDKFQYDEPQGKVLRRLSDGVVEINLGSDVLVRQGLTFTVLPNDYPEKGRQSRMRIYRIPDGKGEYKPVERFVEKATIEVMEILGPKLSRCRITNEAEPLRDAVGPGDLLYNAVWRKGTADHIALIGVFDVNGDGSDDISSVIRDFQKMGVPVDAFFNLKTRQWVGQIDPQTRFIIQGYYPITTSAHDPKKDEKSKLIEAMNEAVKGAQLKGGAQLVNFRDFFPRMGYRVKLDVTPDKINQAAAPYLLGASSADAVNPMQ
jgi:hypothetical protein